MAVFVRDEWVCWLCGVTCQKEWGSPQSATVDHLIPRSLGGDHEMDNLATACFSCNTKRGASMTYDEVSA